MKYYYTVQPIPCFGCAIRHPRPHFVSFMFYEIIGLQASKLISNVTTDN